MSMKMKKFGRIFATVVTFCITVTMLCLAFTACGGPEPDNPDNPGGQAKVTSIALDTSEVKTEFAFAETFTYAGLKVTATMSDGSTKDVPIGDCRVIAPDMEKSGKRNVSVSYSGQTARYQIVIAQKIIPEISATSLLSIEGENDSVAYRVEAEAIDMETPGAKKAEGVTSFVADAPEDAEITSGGKYLTGFGVKWNYFGFTFESDAEHKDVTVVLRLTYGGEDASINLTDNLNMYLNYAETDDEVTGAIPLTGMVDKGVCAWKDVVIRGVTIPAGTNKLTFEALGNKVPDIDYIDFYVGMRYISSIAEIPSEGTLMKDLETFDTEMASTRKDWADANPDKIVNGLGLETVTKESEGKTTSGGKSVAALDTGSQLSTTLRLAKDATVKLDFIASSTDSYIVKDRWEFYIDGIRLELVEKVDIKGGNPLAGEYWDWNPTCLGIYNLPAGDHLFLVKNTGGACNIDGVLFETVSYDGFDKSGSDLDNQILPHECGNVCPACGGCTDEECADPVCATKCECGDYDVTINGEGSFKAEAESLRDRSGWVMRPDLAEAGHSFTENWSNDFGSGVCAKAFATGSVIKVSVNVTEATTLALSMRMSYYDAETYNWEDTTLTFADQTLTPVPAGAFGHREPADYWKWVDVSLGTISVEAGTYELCFTLVAGPNLDYFEFKTVTEGA